LIGPLSGGEILTSFAEKKWLLIFDNAG